MGDVRVRFAPSPTGYLHVGGARTALFNYLFAKQHNGQFVLRIEDTDLARSTEQSVDGILEGMEFLGLEWDEGPKREGDFGPYFQSQRLDLYQKSADQLLASDRAYQCFCTPDELGAMRQAAMEKKEDPKYDGRCRNLTAERRQELMDQGLKSVLRFKANTEGVTRINDRIRGLVTFENKLTDDFVIWKSDGMPTYNFAVVVDDALMQISHVIRGDDHLSNTPKQVQIYEALGYPIPEFAHIPMILGPDKSRLSKRHGATSVTQFKDEGYVQEAMVNYLALLGWSYNDSQTLFSQAELVEKFSLQKVSKNPAVFDIQKLQWMNGVYIREFSPEQLYQLVLPLWQSYGFLPDAPSIKEKERAQAILGELQSRAKLLTDFEEAAYYFYRDELHYNEKAVKKVLYKGQAMEILSHLLVEFMKLDHFTQESLEPIFQQAQEQFQCKFGDIIQPVRVAVTGTNVSPGIYEVLALLSEAKVCQRIKEAVEMGKTHENEVKR